MEILDFCEECSKPTTLDKLSSVGLRCADCDPCGIEDEGNAVRTPDQILDESPNEISWGTGDHYD